MNKTLFDKPANSLINRYRPGQIENIVGQPHLVGENGILSKLISRNNFPSMIFWGPPGTGKTSVAELLSKKSGMLFVPVSAVTHGVKELKKIVEDNYKAYGKFFLFVDEIHHFNKKQQDFFLPYIETEKIIFIGATTENPSYYVIKALMSRCYLLKFNSIDSETIIEKLKYITKEEKGDSEFIPHDIFSLIASYSSGDLRRAINLLEIILLTFEKEFNREQFETIFPGMFLNYDKKSDEHYNLISAFIKSMRGSDPDGAVYYLARMLESGEDPLFIARRMIIFASEDIGNADPVALMIAVAAKEAFESTGDAEGWLPLANAAIYLASTDKSNSVYTAYKKARQTVEETGSLKIPKEISFGGNSFAKSLGNGVDYKYPHDYPGHFVLFNYLPEKIKNKIFYEPSDEGRERRLKERLSRLWKNYKDHK